MNNYIKSPLNYTGGKFLLLDKIIPNLPDDINTFVDLFSGGFNVGINVRAKNIVCNDHNDFLINLFKYFKEQDTGTIIKEINTVIEYYELTDENKEGYLKLRENYNASKTPLKLFVLTCFSFNHQIRFNNSHDFNVPFGLKRSKYNKKIEENLKNFCAAMKTKNITFSAKNFVDFPYSTLTNKDFVYLDPPYLISKASYNDGNRGFRDWQEKQEKELISFLETLDKQKIKFMLSNVLENNDKTNVLLDNASKNYSILYLDKDYSNCNYQRKNKTKNSKEVLITNY